MNFTCQILITLGFCFSFLFVTPAEQFLYDRNKQQNMASFLTEPDITEADEDDTQKRPELSELDTVKLVSCMEVIRNVIGDEMTEAMLTEEIIKANFDAEIALDKILKSTSSLTLSGTLPVLIIFFPF